MKRKIYTFASIILTLIVIMGCSIENKGETGKSTTDSHSELAPEATPLTDEYDSRPTSVRDENPSEWFGVYEIDDEIFSRMKGKSYKENCIVPLADLRYLTVAHYTLEGEVKKGEIVCNKAIAEDLIDIFTNLYNAKYPIERIELVDNYDADDRKSMNANNTSCFNYRVVAGSKNLSNHALGLAIDINPFYNPYVKKQKDGSLYVSPTAARKYADRNGTYPYKIDENDLCYKEFIAHGFTWGGAWNSLKDYQHFEKKVPGLNYKR